MAIWDMLVYNPVFWLGLTVFIFVIIFLSWEERREKEATLEKRIKELEKKLEKQDGDS